MLSISELEEILVKILFFEEKNIKDEKFVEYSKLDPKSFGELYETLLEYDLRIAQILLFIVLFKMVLSHSY